MCLFKCLNVILLTIYVLTFDITAFDSDDVCTFDLENVGRIPLSLHPWVSRNNTQESSKPRPLLSPLCSKDKENLYPNIPGKRDAKRVDEATLFNSFNSRNPKDTLVRVFFSFNV